MALRALVPAPTTLARYGLDPDGWLAILAQQGNVCAICGRLPPSGRLVIDHEHAKGWKRMKPWVRKVHVRGLLCWTCNRYYLARGMSPYRAENIGRYLRQHDNRRNRAWAELMETATVERSQGVADDSLADNLRRLRDNENV